MNDWAGNLSVPAPAIDIAHAAKVLSWKAKAKIDGFPLLASGGKTL